MDADSTLQLEKAARPNTGNPFRLKKGLLVRQVTVVSATSLTFVLSNSTERTGSFVSIQVELNPKLIT